MGDAQSAQREEQREGEHGPSGESTHDKQMQNNGQVSECNSKQDETTADIDSPCEEQFAKEALVVEDISVIGSAPEEVANVQIIQEELPQPNEEEPVEIINMDAKQNDLNESFRRFFSNIGLKLTVKKGTGDHAEDEAENEGIEKLDVLEETTTETKYEDAEQSTDLNVIQDNDSTTCPTLTEGTSDNVAETEEEKIPETKEIADNAEGQEANVTLFEKDDNQNINATQQSPSDQEIVSPIKKFFTTGIFAGLKKKKIEDEDKELVDMSKTEADAIVDQLTSSNVQEQDIECKEVPEVTVQTNDPPEVEDRGKSPSTDQDSDSELTSSQERVLSSPLKRLLSGTTFKRGSKRQKGRRASDSKLSDSGEQIGNQIVASSEKTEQHEMVVETPSPPPSTTDPEEELSTWEAFKKLMTPKKSLTRSSVGSEEVQVQTVAVEETKLREGERISDHSTEEGRKRKDSSHSWEAVLCGSGRRRSRKTSDSEDEQKKDVGEGGSPNEAGDVVTSVPKQASSPSDSESSTWKSFKKLMTPKRKVKDEEESKDNAQSDSEAPQEETLFSIKKLLSGRKKGKPGDKQDQLSSDEGDKEVVSMEEDSETPAVVPLSEFDKSETEETAKTDVEIQDSDLESEREHILEIPKTFVQEVQEHQVTPIIPLNQNQDELTEFSKYQPLSDIPEEGNVTETIATSVKEDVGKDDTIADDMVELTSEAITAPEPVDITMADETDELMLSAASHLTESSKTSGNATPVPVEYDAKDTEVFLEEVVEAISTAKASTFCSEEPALERVVSSVTHELFERCASEEQRIMEIKEQSVAVTFETGLQVDKIKDTDVEMPITVFSESLSEFKDAISTQCVSEVSKMEFESAKIDVDEVYTAKQKRAVKQESVDDSDYMIESLSEVPEYIDVALQGESTELLLGEKVKEIGPKDEEDSIVEIDKEEEALQEQEALSGSTEIIKTVQQDQPEAEEIIDVLTVSLEGTPGLDKELSNEQAPGEIHEATETSEEVEIVAEDGFEIVYKHDVEDIPTLEPTQEATNFPETAVEEVPVQQEETVPVTDVVVKEDIGEDIALEEPEQKNMGEIDQDIIEQQSSKIIIEANKEDVFEVISEHESRQQTDDVVPEVAISQIEFFTNKLLEETSEVEIIEQIVLPSDQATLEQTTEELSDIAELADTPLPDFATQELLETFEEDLIEHIVEQTTDEVSREATQLDGIGELEDTLLPEVAADELLEETSEEERIKQMVPSSDQEIVEHKIDKVSTEAAQQDDIGELEDTLLPDVAADELLEEKIEEEHIKQIVPSSDQEIMEQTIDKVSTKADQQDDIGELEDTLLPDVAADELLEEKFEEEHIKLIVPSSDQEIVEQTIDEVSTKAAQQDDTGELEDTLVPDVAADELLEETFEEEHIKLIVPSSDQEIVEQTIDEVSTKATQQDDTGELKDTLVPDVAADELLEETFEEEHIKPIVPSSDQEIVERTIDEVSTKATQQDDTGELEDTLLPEVSAEEFVEQIIEEFCTEAVQQSDICELGDTLLPEVATDEEIIKQIVPSNDQEIVEEVSKAAQQDDLGELEDTQVAADETDDKVLEKIESQQQEVIPEEGTNVLNGQGFASSAEECESEAISQLDHASYVNGDHTEARPSEAQIMQMDHHYVVAEDLEAFPVEHVSSVNEDSGIAQVLEDTINIEKMSEILVTTTEEPIHEVHIGEMEVSVEEQLAEELPCPVTDVAEVKHAALLEKNTVMLQQVTATIPELMITKIVEGSDGLVEETFLPFVNNAEVLNEPKDEVQITEVEQVGIQGEKEEQIVPPETTNVDVQHTLVAQLTTCSFKEVQLPDVSIETTTATHEPILSMVVSEQEDQEAIETTTPVEVNNITQVLQEGSTVILMKVPAVEFEDSHQVQVQVVNVDIQSAEAQLDTALQIGVLEDNEVVDSCHEMVERVDSVSATSIIEQEIVNENDKVAVRGVVQHVKETAPQSEEVEYKELPTDLNESKLIDVCKMTASQDQPPLVAAIQDAVIAKEHVLTKMDEDVKDVHEQASAENQVATPGSTAVTVPQNTGLISSVGNMESPSSLSLEFKLNIQFGQNKAPTLPPQPTHFAAEQSVSSPPQSPKAAPPVDQNEPAKTTEMSEVGVQAVEEETEQENKPQKTEIVMAEAAVQATETNEEPDLMDTLKNESIDVGIQSADTEEPVEETTAIAIIQNKTVLMDVSTQYTEISGQGEEVKAEEIAMVDNQPVLIDVGTQQEETNKEVKTTVEEISSVQISVQAEDIEEKGILQTELVVLQISKDKIKETEDDDENQDVWMDAEEDIDAQEQKTMPLCEIEEYFESEPGYFQETKTDFEESLDNIKQKSLKCDIDSEGEDFAVALEDPQIATAIATVEWD